MSEAIETKIEFPYFNEQKQVRLFSLAFNDDMRHTLTVQLGELSMTLNAHDVLKLLEWLAEFGEDIEALSEQLNEAALIADNADMAQIAREWRAYRNEGLGERG